MRPANLGAGAVDAPDCLFHVDLCPCGAADLAGTGKGQRRELKSAPECRPAVIDIYGRQKRTEMLLVGDRGPVLYFGCLQGAAQEKRRIVLGSQRGDSKPEDGANYAAQPTSRLPASAAFDPLQQYEDFCRGDFSDWSGAKVGAGKVDKQPSVLRDGGRGGPSASMRSRYSSAMPPNVFVAEMTAVSFSTFLLAPGSTPEANSSWPHRAAGAHRRGIRTGRRRGRTSSASR